MLTVLIITCGTIANIFKQLKLVAETCKWAVGYYILGDLQIKM